MDLKQTKFAVLCENAGSVAHKWFMENVAYDIEWCITSEYYIYTPDSSGCSIWHDKPTDIPVYTEKQFADLLNKSNNKLLNYNHY